MSVENVTTALQVNATTGAQETPADFQNHFLWVVLGEAIMIFIFAMIYARGFAAGGVGPGVRLGIMFGIVYTGADQLSPANHSSPTPAFQGRCSCLQF